MALKILKCTLRTVQSINPLIFFVTIFCPSLMCTLKLTSSPFQPFELDHSNAYLEKQIKKKERENEPIKINPMNKLNVALIFK